MAVRPPVPLERQVAFRRRRGINLAGGTEAGFDRAFGPPAFHGREIPREMDAVLGSGPLPDHPGAVHRRAAERGPNPRLLRPRELMEGDYLADRLQHRVARAPGRARLVADQAPIDEGGDQIEHAWGGRRLGGGARLARPA